MNFIQFEITNAIAKITLNRAEKFNSFNRVMTLELLDALSNAAAAKEVRVICIFASGKAFSAGQDLTEALALDGGGIYKVVAEHYNPLIKKIRTIEKPVVCAVNGVAVGAGANIALACDIVIAARSASFTQAFGKIGLIPDSGGTFMLPRLIGLQRAAALMMLGEKVTAEQACNMGMIYKVSEDEKLLEDVMHTAEYLAQLPTVSIGLTKRLLNQSTFNSLENQLELEAITQVEAASTTDHKEGVLAFVEKRKPIFKGE